MQPDNRHRRSIRLSGYDYGQSNSYFVTICAGQRQCLFGEVQDVFSPLFLPAASILLAVRHLSW